LGKKNEATDVTKANENIVITYTTSVRVFVRREHIATVASQELFDSIFS